MFETVRIDLLRPLELRLHVVAAPDEEIEPLVASIAHDGVGVIPVVRRLASGVLEILTERSVVRAAALAGLADIRVEVREGISDRAAMRIAITGERTRPAGTTPWSEALDVAGHARLMEAETGTYPTQRFRSRPISPTSRSSPLSTVCSGSRACRTIWSAQACLFTL